MRLTARPLISVPVLLALAAAAFLAMWAWSPAGGGGLTESGRTNVNVEYTVRDAFGVIKAHGLLHNATTDNLLDDAADRLSTTGITTATANIYSNITLCSTNPNATLNNSDGFTPAGICTLTSNVGTNPVVSSVTPGTASYTAVTTFTASGAATIAELQLSKNLSASTAPANVDLGASQDVSITPASSDTLEITSTVTIN